MTGVQTCALPIFGEAAGYEAAARPGMQLVLSNEAVADMNMLVVGAGADHGHFRSILNSCLNRQLPFLAILFPSADKAFDDIAADLGLAYAVDLGITVVSVDSTLDISQNLQNQAGPEQVAAERQKLQQSADDIKIYPVIRAALGYRF